VTPVFLSILASRRRATLAVELLGDDQPDRGPGRGRVVWRRVGALVAAHRRALGVSEESARDEARWTALQHGYGVPDDLSGLDSPS
jgi:hypothetical protein